MIQIANLTDTSAATLVVGVGLIGASVAAALTRAGYQVFLQDQISSHALVAASMGAGSLAEPTPEAIGLVVVAVPPQASAAVISESLHRYPNATVTDVTSVKAAVLADVVGDTARFVGSHPMAGSQHAGPITANPDLFRDRTWVITPHPGNSDSTVKVVADLATACGAEVVIMDAQDHDQAVAAVSHLPHLAAVLVARQLVDLPESHVRLAGQGVRDVTRIAGSDPQLWSQIVTGNAGSLRPRLEQLRAGIDELLAGLDDPHQVGALLSQGVAGTKRIPGKHGRSAIDWSHVVVEIPDAPGGLARLFADVSAAGINVEEVAIEHDSVRAVGFLSISVVPDEAAALRTLLTDAGWSVRA